MDNKLIDLTPRGILYNLKKIEQAVRHDNLEIYHPNFISQTSILNNAILCEEAKAMLEFVGLRNYTTDVKFDLTPDGVAGNITSANNNAEKTVHIIVSIDYKNKWKSCLAILAHEICHKLLYVHGLYELNTELNETLVDLSTIYVGFGNLILNGYTSEAQTQIIGYLNLNNYKVAHHIVSVVYGKEKLTTTGLSGVDFLIDDALEYWQNSKSEHELMKKCFIESEYQIAEIHRNLTLIEQIIKLCKHDLIHEFAKYDNIFFKTLEEKDGQYRNKLTALSMLYEMVAKDSFPKHKENTFLKELNETLSNSIYGIIQQYQSKHAIELKYDFECPYCGTKMPNDGKIIDRNTILRCPKCGCHYYFFGEKINFSKRQRELKEMREKRDETIEKMVTERLQVLRKNDDARVQKAKQDAKDAIDNAKKSIEIAKAEANFKILDIRSNEQEAYKQKVRNRTPKILLWIINKYL